jgi:hypothetical protein
MSHGSTGVGGRTKKLIQTLIVAGHFPFDSLLAVSKLSQNNEVGKLIS